MIPGNDPRSKPLEKLSPEGVTQILEFLLDLAYRLQLSCPSSFCLTVLCECPVCTVLVPE